MMQDCAIDDPAKSFSNNTWWDLECCHRAPIYCQLSRQNFFFCVFFLIHRRAGKLFVPFLHDLWARSFALIKTNRKVISDANWIPLCLSCVGHCVIARSTFLPLVDCEYVSGSQTWRLVDTKQFNKVLERIFLENECLPTGIWFHI